ncbi:hypothetical protein [Peloplasma aerotolerans]|jgi:uncharacterized membrane protein HdeD (DUF308 family)|uniref:DUF308 domain-containing protein n=1 Tax=Peloplasma aerotolerans TaxID=3044389 RepID=A0AAW6U6F7_9MOLU|nr:hypothetical protein [Mariniplasma sp. M4Ah]MDI6452159.1 hypothetical protein [Mariniplasma sp. M4Ah]MDR4968815.1 hypothetical protein [Acholeplasmataceae bacterium]
MLDQMKKFPIVNIVIGVILIVLGIVFVFIQPDIGENIKNVAIGLMILAIVVLLIYPGLKKPKSKLILSLLILELIIGLLVSIMFITNTGGSPSLWIGLVIYVHGVVGLIGGYFSAEKQKMWLFFLSLLFVSIGVFIFASNLITNEMLIHVLLFIFLAPGLFLLALGLLNLKKQPKQVE